MARIHKFKLTDKDITDLREVLNGIYAKNRSNSYWDKVDYFIELFKEDEVIMGDESD